MRAKKPESSIHKEFLLHKASTRSRRRDSIRSFKKIEAIKKGKKKKKKTFFTGLLWIFRRLGRRKNLERRKNSSCVCAKKKYSNIEKRNFVLYFRAEGKQKSGATIRKLSKTPQQKSSFVENYWPCEICCWIWESVPFDDLSYHRCHSSTQNLVFVPSLTLS